MTLRYPADRPQSADYVTFKHQKYSRGGGGGGGEGGIVLYMPAPAPSVTNANQWSGSGDKFAGEFGQAKRNILQGAVEAMDAESFNLENVLAGAQKITQSLKGTKVGELARQIGVMKLGQSMNLTAQQALSVTKGQIYNPNIEMMYEGPQLRGFTFSFQCSPKSSQDAQAIRNIVREFKKWSAPKPQGQKWNIPHVWQVTYGGQAKQYYNKFKPAALTAIDVQYNPGIDSHMTFNDGAPIVTGLSLSFLETQLITQDDNGDY